MNRDLLEEISMSKKKNDISNTRKREFRVELENALKEVGLTEETVRYIITCASLGSAISFRNWIRNMDEVQINELYTQLASTKAFQENANMNTARFLLTLIIANMGDDMKFSFITADAIRRVPDLLLTKEGKVAANANKIIIFNFIEYVGVYKKWYALKELGLSDIERKQFVSIIRRAAEEYKPRNEDQRYAIRNLSEWLKGETMEMEEITHVEPDEKAFAGEVTDTTPNKVMTGEMQGHQIRQNQSQNYIHKGDDCKPATERKSTAAKRLLEIASYVEAVETDCDRIKAEFETIRKEKENFQRLYDRARQSIKEKEESFAKLEETLKETRKQLDEKDKMIEELEASIQKQSDVYTIYSTDSESKHAEKMNAIAARLRGEYKDFLESKTMEMTIDLGLNLQDQLEEVFNILMNNGIDIKGR